MNQNVKPGPGGWTEIDLPTVSGRRSARAQIIGPFAVHEAVEFFCSKWTITHVRTGCVVGRHGNYGICANVARRLKELYADTDLDCADPFDVQKRLLSKRGALLETMKTTTMNGTATTKARTDMNPWDMSWAQRQKEVERLTSDARDALEEAWEEILELRLQATEKDERIQELENRVLELEEED